jgi:crotonobetainyl-CoA:carnitine CoA-transferase CaiB-like acyl-CoA transferase
MGDTVSGYLLVAEVCAALLRRERTGQGDLVKSSLLHNSIFTMGTMAITSQPPFGRVYPEDRPGWSAPCGDYQCADGEWVFLSGYTAAMYPVLYKLIGREDLETDPRFNTAMGRWDNRHEYYAIVKEAFLQKPSSYWLEGAKKLDLPMTRMGHYRDLVTDPQVLANNYVEQVEFRSYHTMFLGRCNYYLYYRRIGCSCLPSSAASRVAGSFAKSATRLVGLPMASSCPKGTK